MVVSPRCLERGAIPRLRHTINVRDDRPPSKQAARSAPSNSAVARLAWRADRGPLPHLRRLRLSRDQIVLERGNGLFRGEFVAEQAGFFARRLRRKGPE